MQYTSAVVRFFAVRGEKLVEIYHLIREMYGDDWAFITIRFANQMVNLNRPPHTAKNELLHDHLCNTAARVRALLSTGEKIRVFQHSNIKLPHQVIFLA